jgi:hypothetical protein
MNDAQRDQASPTSNPRRCAEGFLQRTGAAMVKGSDSMEGGRLNEKQPDRIEVARWLAEHGRVAELVIASTLERVGSSQPGELERLLVEVARRMAQRIDFEAATPSMLPSRSRGSESNWGAWHLAVAVRRMVIRELLPMRRDAS